MRSHRDSPDKDDAIGRLIRLTGEQRGIPDAALEAAREAARLHWRRDLELRARKRKWTTAALAAAAMLVLGLGLALLLGRGAAEPTIVAHVETLKGSIAAAVGEEPAVAVAAGAALTSGTRVELAPDSGAALLMAGGVSVRIAGGTRVRLESVSTVFVEQGAIYCDASREDASIVVRTPFGRVRDIGTQFEVRVLEAAMRVRVREGEVLLDGDRGPESIAAGVELTWGAGGAVRASIPRYGSEWAWAEALAPAPEIDGGNASLLLDWASREMGLELGYDDETARNSAQHAVLHGSVAGLTPAEALAAVLPTIGLTHRVEDARLVVGQTPMD